MPMSNLSENDFKLMDAHKVIHKGFTIRLKRDFGSQWFLIDGMPCMWGFVVTQNGMNVMPGATWFQTVKDAKQGIEALIKARESDQGEAAFWDILKAMKEPSVEPVVVAVRISGGLFQDHLASAPVNVIVVDEDDADDDPSLPSWNQVITENGLL